MTKNLTDKQKNMLGSAATGLSSGIGLGTSLAQIDDTSGQEALIEGVGSTQFAGGDTSTLLSSFDANNLARTNYTADEIRGFTDDQLVGNILASTTTGALNGAMKGGLVGALLEGGSNFIGGAIGALDGDAKAQKRAAQLNSLAEENNKIYLNNFANAVSNTQNKMFNNSLLNIGAYGGPLFNHGGDWSNDLTFINEGGTHEQNPLGGIPVGVDQEGIPNLVEEGEIIWNDYVFSNRLKPTKKQLETLGFDLKYEGYTFAKIVEDVQKTSAENPLDKISTDTLNENLMYLMTMQEEIRNKKNNTNNKFPYGGLLYDDLNLNFKPTTFVPSIIGKPELTYELEVSKEQPIDMFGTTKPKNLAEQIVAKAFEETVPVPKLDYTKESTKESEVAQTSEEIPWQSALRYASPLVHGLTLLHNLQEPDYSEEKALMKRANSVTRGSYTPLGNTLDLDLVDRNVYTNPILANASATRRAIMQNSTNAGSANAALLANNYLTNTALGAADIQGIQANNAIKSQKAQFDLTRDQANSQMGLQALAMDQQADKLGLSTMANAIQSMNAKNNMRNQAISSSLTGIADDLGSIGREFIDRDLMKKLISSDALKWSSKNGGMLTGNRRKK